MRRRLLDDRLLYDTLFNIGLNTGVFGIGELKHCDVMINSATKNQILNKPKFTVYAWYLQLSSFY